MKKNKVLKLNFMLLTLFLILSGCSKENSGSSSTSESTSGDIGQVTNISSREDLELLRSDSKGSFKLTKDINLNEEEWTPIESFRGVLDGDGFKIEGLKITKATGDIGFFRNLTGATIKNITFSNAEVSNVIETNIEPYRLFNAAIISGSVGTKMLFLNHPTVFDNVKVVESTLLITEVENYGYYTGAFVGYSDFGKLEIKNSKNEARVVATRNVGGFIGLVKGEVSIENSNNSGDVSAVEFVTEAILMINAGGFIGVSINDTVTLKDCTNNGNIVSLYSAAGFIGFSDLNMVYISGCTNNGNITSKSYAGAYIGLKLGVGLEETNNTNTGVLTAPYL